MKKNINNYWSVLFSFTIMLLASQLMACDQMPAGTEQKDRPEMGENAELSEGFPLKQKGDGISRISIKINDDQLFLQIDDNKFSVTDTKGELVKGCSECTQSIRDQFGLGDNCEDAEEQFGFKMCGLDISTHHCTETQCEYTFDNLRICGDCAK